MDKFNKIFRIVYLSLLALSVIAIGWYFIVAYQGSCLACEAPKLQSTDQIADEVAPSAADIESGVAEEGVCTKECYSYTGVILTFTLILVIIAMVLTIALVVYTLAIRIIKSFMLHQNKTIFWTLLIVVVTVIISRFVLASPEIPNILGYEGEILPEDVLLTETVLYTTYILVVTSVVALLSSLVTKFIKK